MATTKQIDIFGQLHGLEFHLALETAENESGMEALVKAVDYLVSKGASARAVKSFGGGGKQSAPPPDKCPECGGEVIAKNWTNQEGKSFKIYKCKTESHFKPIYRPA